MNSSEKALPEDFLVRLGQEEIGLIFDLRENLDYSEQLVSQALRYQELGWRPRAVTASGGADLGLNFRQSEESLYEQISGIQQTGVKLHLGLPTPGGARLLVVEIQSDRGLAALDRLGNWRSPCFAHTEDGREQHYYLLPMGFTAPRTVHLQEMDIKVYGEGGLALAPPTTAPEFQAPWQWCASPWETWPDPPGPAIWDLLRESQAFGERPDPASVTELSSWEEIYRRIASFGEIVHALVAPAASYDQYYARLLNTALEYGLNDPTLVLGLLWHAPRGDLKDNPQRWPHLQSLASTASFWQPDESATQEADASKGGDEALGNPTPSEMFSFLEKRVILERGRYEAMISEMSEMASKAADLERRLADQEERLKAPPSVAPAPEPQLGAEAAAAETGPAWRELASDRSANGMQAIFREFLAQNPDLSASDRVQMLQFYLKNYIDINPENHGLTFRQKLTKAARMVRDFLGE